MLPAYPWPQTNTCNAQWHVTVSGALLHVPLQVVFGAMEQQLRMSVQQKQAAEKRQTREVSPQSRASRLRQVLG